MTTVLWYDNTDLSKEGSGQQAKTAPLIKYLAKHLNIVLLCPCENKDFISFDNNIEVIRIPNINQYNSWFSIDLASKIFSAIRNFRPDLIMFSHIYGAPTILLLSSLKKIPTIYDSHGLEFELIADNSLRSILMIKSLESYVLKLTNKIIALSEQDKRMFKFYYKVSDDKIRVIDPPKQNNTCRESERKTGRVSLAKRWGMDLLNKPIFIFHGSLSYPPNKEAVKFILEFIAPQVSEAVFLIVGKDAPYIGRLGNIIFTGFVKNLREVLCAADFAIVPLRRVTGVSMKVIDYISCGLPIIVTPTILRYLNPNEVEGTLIISSISDMPLKAREILKVPAKRTKWKFERTYDDIVHDYLKVIKEVILVRGS